MARYELIERIGIGGMAEIFRGQATSGGGFVKPVAIKRILPHLSQDARFVKQLISEANVLSKLRHRNIVQIYDVGLGDDGQNFLVMEFVDGVSLYALYEYLERRRIRFPVELALHIGAEVCEALEHAHRGVAGKNEDGLVHLDISPGNILLSKSGETKLTNFGIAKRPDDVTAHGGVRGKFAYIAPEQASGERVDARSDVFSLGIVLYEFMTGCRLFSRLPDMEALEAVKAGHMPLPSTQDPELPRELENLLVRALAPLPDDRFPSAAAFGAKMRELRYALDESVSEPTAQVRSWVSRCQSAEISSKHGSNYSPGFTAEEKTVVKMVTAPGFEKSLSEEEELDDSSLSYTSIDDRAQIEFDDSKTQIRFRGELPLPGPGDPDYLAKLEELSSSGAGQSGGAVSPSTKSKGPERAGSSTTAVKAPRGHTVDPLSKPATSAPSVSGTPAASLDDPGGWGQMKSGMHSRGGVPSPHIETRQGEQSRWILALFVLVVLAIATALAARFWFDRNQVAPDSIEAGDKVEEEAPLEPRAPTGEETDNGESTGDPEPTASPADAELTRKRRAAAKKRRARRKRAKRRRAKRRREKRRSKKKK